MDTTLGMSLEHLLREVLLGRNPTEGSAKGSPTSLAAVMWCLKLKESSRHGSAAAAAPHMPQLCMTGGAIRRKSNIHETVAVVEAGFKYSPKQQLLLIFLLSHCWMWEQNIGLAGAMQLKVVFVSLKSLTVEMVKFNYTTAQPSQMTLPLKVQYS